MAQPTPYERQFAFSGQPKATWAEGLENELNAVKVTSDETLANLELIQRDDGALRNGIVTRDSLAPDVALAGLVALDFADEATAVAASASNVAMAPLGVKQQIDARLADQATAEAGTDNSALMTPLRTKQQADARLASQSEAEAGSNNTKTMTPLRGKQQIDARLADEATAIAGINATELLTPETGKASIVANAKDATISQAGTAARVRTIQDSYREDITVSALSQYDPTDSGIQQAINRAIDAVIARGANGGRVVVPNLGSSYTLTGKIVLKDNILLEGDGMPTLRLANGVNTSLVEGENFLTLSGTNSGSGVDGYGLRNLILDGNRANNTGAPANEGHGVAIYGRDFTIETIEVINTRRRGVHLEYGDTTVGVSPYNGAAFDILVNTTGEEGFYNSVSDMHVHSLNVRTSGQNADNTYDAINLIRSIRATNVNVWMGGTSGVYQRYSLRIGANAEGTTISGAHLETAKTAQILLSSATCMLDCIQSYNLLGNDHLILDGSRNKVSMNAFTTGFGLENAAANCVRAINSRVSNEIDVSASGITGPLFVFTSTFGANLFKGRAFVSPGYVPYTGKAHPTDRVEITTAGNNAAEHMSLTKLPGSATSISGNGSVQADAALISRSSARLFPNGVNTAFRLPPAMTGMMFIASNVGSVSAVIFPSSGDNHRGSAANASVSLAAGSQAIYFAHSDAEWIPL